MFKWLSGLVDSNEKEIKRVSPLVERINALESEITGLSDSQLKGKTAEYKARLNNGETLDDILPEAFAAVREAARRTLGQRHFDVQLAGGIVLHQGKIAEMKTGEGKTLVATLPLYLNSLTGEGCHLITVNDYLSKRDPHWMGPIYDVLGVSVASIQHDASFIYDPSYEDEEGKWHYMRPVSRAEAYKADITYGTNNEFGFDYLRENMVIDLARCVQRPLNYAIVDEVDNILIDEARTPLIISSPAEEAEQMYHVFARLVPRLHRDEDYTIDEKTRSVSLTDAGISNVEKILKRDGLLTGSNLYDPANYMLNRYLDNALIAQVLYKKDRDYVVKTGEIVIVDEFTGRLMTGRRYSQGIHQAIEAKEGVEVQRESRTYATITFQNYFRMYEKLAGMTGTAVTEAEEFHKIYGLEVVVIPTNMPMVRQDNNDQIYKSEEAKYKAVTKEVEQLYKEGHPVLIGTVSIEKSENLSHMLKKRGIPYQVLNAKNHEREADIIKQAGRLGAVTVATNMAGRGVDIILGGNPSERDKEEWQKEHDEVIARGGLHVVGTERHEARRIDNQLRGRAGRQGDPGSTRFYVSLEDDVMRRFGGERIMGMMEWAGVGEEVPIENKLVNRAIESAQVKVEGFHFDMRKHLVEFDDVVNTQRQIIYDERRKVLADADLKTNILNMVGEEIANIVYAHLGNGREEVDYTAMLKELSAVLPLPSDVNSDTVSKLSVDDIESKINKYAEHLYEQREADMGSESMRILERLLMLRVIDSLWVEHLTVMEDMRREAGWQSLRQIRPVDAYKKKGYEMFQNLMNHIKHDVAHTIFHAGLTRQSVQQRTPVTAAAGARDGKVKHKAGGKKTGRNDLCPCGSGKKYKHCCGR